MEQKKEQLQNTGTETVQKEKGSADLRGIIVALIFGLSSIVCVIILTQSFLAYKGKSGSEGITATGSASCDFESDLIVWRGSFSAFAETTDSAYKTIKHDAQMVKEYLEENGIQESEMVFNSVNISKHYNSIYNAEGNYVGDELIGYDLFQDVSVSSTDVDKVEKISRDITGLIESGIEFTSDSPEYYYTKLDELKLQLIEDATKNAKERIGLIAVGAGSHEGDLLEASLGVFQITARNSAAEEYSYGGTFNTSSRSKTATITVRLNYAVK